jgi:hypothetical protein
MKKLYYFPGVISLIAFFFLLPFCYKKIAPQKINLLRLNVPSLNPNPLLPYTERGILKYNSKKRKLNICLDDDVKTNSKKLELIRFEAKKLKYTFDTSSIIVIKFSDDMSYGQFIKLVDICKTDSIRRYAPFQNYFIIYGESPPTEPKTIKESSFIFFDDVVRIQQPPPKESFEEKLIVAIKPYLRFDIISLVSGWIILVITHLHYGRKRRLQTFH